MHRRLVGEAAVTKECGFASDLPLLIGQELLVPFVGRETNGHLGYDACDYSTQAFVQA